MAVLRKQQNIMTVSIVVLIDDVLEKSNFIGDGFLEDWNMVHWCDWWKTH